MKFEFFKIRKRSLILRDFLCLFLLSFKDQNCLWDIVRSLFQSLDSIFKIEILWRILLTFDDFHHFWIKFDFVNFFNDFKSESDFFSKDSIFPVSELKIGFVEFDVAQTVWNSVFLDFQWNLEFKGSLSFYEVLSLVNFFKNLSGSVWVVTDEVDSVFHWVLSIVFELNFSEKNITWVSEKDLFSFT